MPLGELIVGAVQGQSAWYIMYGNRLISHDPLVHTQSEALWLVMDGLVLVVLLCPERFLELVFHRLLVLQIRDRPFGIHLAGVYKIDRNLFRVFHVYRSEIYITVRETPKLLVRHLYPQPRTVKPTNKINYLSRTIGIGYS